jgi:membrane protease YdiL (CAAX protease family)
MPNSVGSERKVREKNSKAFFQVTEVKDVFILNSYLLICLFVFVVANRTTHRIFKSNLLFNYRDIALFSLWSTILLLKYSPNIRKLFLFEKKKRDLISGIDFAIALTCFYCLTKSAAILLRILLSGKYTPISNQDIAFYGQTIGSLVIHGVIAVSVAPFIEEIIFRGLFYPPLRSKLGPKFAIIASSVIFTAWHLNAGLRGLINVFIAGILLSYIYEKSESLLSAIAAHSLMNGSQIILLVYEKFATPILEPNRFTLYLTMVYFIFSIFFYFLYRRGRAKTQVQSR